MKRTLWRHLLSFFRGSPALDERLTRFVKELHPETALFLDAPVNPIPRYGYGLPPHKALSAVIGRRRQEYRQLLVRFLHYRKNLMRVPLYVSERRQRQRSLYPAALGVG
jgi:hypothetical protein